MHTETPRFPGLTAILLAAGRGSRFDAMEGKLMQPVGEHGQMLAVVAAQSLLRVLPVVAVVATDGQLARALRAQGCTVVTALPGAAREMSATLRQGVLHTDTDARGWLVALGDMPMVRCDTIALVCQALHDGADIAVPVRQGRRGHPVGFSARHRQALLDLRGDQGARTILAAHQVREIAVDDAGIHVDVDTRADLRALDRRDA
ncbi:NTP transferase domain-containing protein [Herbaspirillum sp. YR522]|uniref:nucleotidyltransferase family protein n=1 Tax=Herbaspirillum sp. YR522 TaxID=1144342 RepID=UPI00026FBCB5|nr:nucleotidyltransferase family protein [Herbaspirillum sp. YR522]EJM95756.1 putative MobA-like protein [Herbaspirillum sp. YR522]